MKLCSTEVLTKNIGRPEKRIYVILTALCEYIFLNIFAGGFPLDNKRPVLIVIQIIISVIVIISAFVIKTVGGDIHAFVGTWFFENYNNSIFTGTAVSPLDFTEETVITETSRIFEENSQ